MTKNAIAIIINIGTYLIYGLIVFLAWNILMPPIWGLPVINYYQGCVGYILSCILIRGGFHSPFLDDKKRYDIYFNDEPLELKDEDEEGGDIQ